MLKDKIAVVINYIVKHSKIAFPIIVIAAVAATVTLALQAGNRERASEIELQPTPTEASVASSEPVDKDVPLALNEDEGISTLINTYYNALALGDADTLRALSDEVPDKDMLHYVKMANYIDHYPVLEIYTKPGYEEGSTIAYVSYKIVFVNQQEQFPGYKAHYICTDEQGQLYMKGSENSDEVNEYIITVSAQDDVVEFNNRIAAEYNELMEAHPELLEYLSSLVEQVSTAVGVTLAQQEAANAQASSSQVVNEGDEENSGQAETTETPAPVDNSVQYATATTTVNVRSSDSEKADKLGKVSGGTKVQVQEVRVNGWTKIVFERKDGYIKSEFLQMVENADNVEAIGTVTATTNINVRSAASQDSQRLGVLAGGESVELIATEGEWCKIKYQGQVAYVKAEFVQQ